MENQDIEFEDELKNMLTKNQYNDLRTIFIVNDKDLKPQTNHFFDTKDYKLYKSVVTLRAREKKNEWELTVKEAALGGKRKETHHRPLLKTQKDQLFHWSIIPAGPVQEALQRLGIVDPVFLQGEMLTERITIKLNYGEIMLDKNSYLDVVDYEIEFEINPDADRAEAEKYFLALLADHGIKRKQSRNKTQRFIEKKIAKSLMLN